MQKAQGEEAPGVTEPRGSLCCVYKNLDKGHGQGTGWHHPGHCIRCWLFTEHAATCLCLHLQWKWLHHSYFQLCVYFPMWTVKQVSQPLFRKSPWLWYVLTPNNWFKSIPRGRNRWCLFCAPSDACSPPLFIFGVGLVDCLLRNWNLVLWLLLIPSVFWMNPSCRLST